MRRKAERIRENKDYERIINNIICCIVNGIEYEGKSLDFKLHSLSELFRLGANAGNINEFITKNGINLDDTSNLY